MAQKGLSDEQQGSYFIVLETSSGGGCYVPLDRHAAHNIHEGDIVRVVRKAQKWRTVDDAVIHQLSQNNQGVYDLAQVVGQVSARPSYYESTVFGVDSSGSTSYGKVAMQGSMGTDVAQRHAARLGQLEKLGLAARLPGGKWHVDPKLVTKLDEKDESEPKSRWIVRRQPLRLDEQVGRRGPVWLDHVRESELAPFGFGADLKEAIARRAEALRRFGIDPAVDEGERRRRLRKLER